MHKHGKRSAILDRSDGSPGRPRNGGKPLPEQRPHAENSLGTDIYGPMLAGDLIQ
jgi:hypothetical protein